MVTCSCYFGKVEEDLKFVKRRLFQLNEEGVECGHEKLKDQSILAIYIHIPGVDRSEKRRVGKECW